MQNMLQEVWKKPCKHVYKATCMSIPNFYIVYSSFKAFATVAPLGDAGAEEV